jgi:hypothetical protein
MYLYAILFFHLSVYVCGSARAGHIPADTVGPPAILHDTAMLKNKPFRNLGVLCCDFLLYPSIYTELHGLLPRVLCMPLDGFCANTDYPPPRFLQRISNRLLIDDKYEGLVLLSAATLLFVKAEL